MPRVRESPDDVEHTCHGANLDHNLAIFIDYFVGFLLLGALLGTERKIHIDAQALAKTEKMSVCRVKIPIKQRHNLV